MSTRNTSNQNEPTGYINISAAIRATFTCCNNINKDVSNNKTNTVENEIKREDSGLEQEIQIEEERTVNNS